MQTITPQSSFEFKGLKLTPGDFISLTPKQLKISASEAAFIRVNERGEIHVLCMMLFFMNRDSVFSPDEIQDIKLLRCAKEAVPFESERGDGVRFEHGQRLSVEVEGDGYHSGSAIAAHEGVITIWSENSGALITGGVDHFNPLC